MRDQRILLFNRKHRIPSCVPNFLDSAQYIFVLSCLIEVITLAGILSRAVITHLLRTRRLPRRGPGHAVPAPAEAAVHVRVHPGHATQHLQHRRQVPHRLRARLRRGQIPQVCGCQSMNVLNIFLKKQLTVSPAPGQCDGSVQAPVLPALRAGPAQSEEQEEWGCRHGEELGKY